MKKEMDIIESARLIMEAEEINWSQKAYDFMKKKSDKFTNAGWQEAVDAKVGVAIPMSKWTETEKLVKQMFATKKEGEEEIDENIVDLIDADGHIMVHGKLDSDDGENYVIAGKKYPKKGLRMKVWEGEEEVDEEAGKQLEWGFDLTDIPAEKWSELVKMFDLKKDREDMGENLKPFSWTGKGIKIVTANDPISGEYHRAKDRDNEKGYASYIGIVGDAELVKNAKNFIKKNATHIKDESPRTRDFI